jgi:hypothetical protein
MISIYLFSSLCVASCVYAVGRGGLPERIAGIALLVAYVLSLTATQGSVHRFHAFEWGLFAIDLFLLAILVYLAHVAQRFWPLWMSAMQVISVLSHLPPAIKENILPWAYREAVSLWSYPMLGLLFAATYWHQQRQRTYGADPAWKALSLE